MDGLSVVRAQREDHPSPGLELAHERLGRLARVRADVDGIERAQIGRAVPAVARAHDQQRAAAGRKRRTAGRRGVGCGAAIGSYELEPSPAQVLYALADKRLQHLDAHHHAALPDQAVQVGEKDAGAGAYVEDAAAAGDQPAGERLERHGVDVRCADCDAMPDGLRRICVRPVRI
jgi:hypothetical protein